MRTVLVVVAVFLLFIQPVYADISRIKDKTGKTVGYIVTEEGTGTVRIKDRTWKTTGYIVGDHIKNRQGRTVASIE